MNENQHAGSFFPASNVIITGGSFNSHVHTGERGGYKRLLDAVAPNALHDSGHIFDPPKCHPGTRVAVIQAIMDWLAGTNEDTRERGVNWLTGAAGAGKSAIGRSVCERSAEERTLLASFFFGSSDTSRNHSKALVATIAYQICAIDNSIRSAVSDFIQSDPHIFTKSLQKQFISLVVGPLSSFYANRRQIIPRLIVIDGLDECVDPAGQRDILQTIKYLISAYPHSPIRFLICSRPEGNIKNILHGADMNQVVSTIFLGTQYNPDQDIRKYLCDKFTSIREDHIFKSSIPAWWPSQYHIDHLVEKSSDQFVYASTVIKYIESPDDMPHQRLDVILGLRAAVENPFAELDALYIHLLTTTKDPPKAAKMLAFIARYPSSSIPVIARYLELEHEEVEIMLSKLAAIVGRESLTYIDYFRLLHKSFEDFIFDEDRSQEFYVSFPDAIVADALCSIKIFSDPSGGCRFQNHFFHWDTPFSSKSVRELEKWLSDSTKGNLINVLLQFPMESFFNELCSCYVPPCVEFQFTHYLFELTSLLKRDNPVLKDVYKNYIIVLFQYAVRNLAIDELASPGCNFNFLAECFKPPRRSVGFVGQLWVWEVFSYYFTKEKDLVTGLITSTQADHLRIIFSRAALFCLQYLCDSGITKVEAERHLKVSGMEKKRRNSHPWKWHRLTAAHNIRKNERKLVCVGPSDEFDRSLLVSYADLPRLNMDDPDIQIYSLASFDWNRAPIFISPSSSVVLPQPNSTVPTPVVPAPNNILPVPEFPTLYSIVPSLYYGNPDCQAQIA